MKVKDELNKHGYVMFSPEEIQTLNYYIYALLDPKDNKPFYVGKGKGQRIFHHLIGALQSNECLEVNDDLVEYEVEAEASLDESLKIQTIKQIHDTYGTVGLHIIKYGIRSENLAYEIEAAVIDAYKLGGFDLTNKVLGQHSNSISLEQFHRIYKADPLEKTINDTDHVVFININGLYPILAKQYEHIGYIPDEEIYKAVRASWTIAYSKTKSLETVIAEYNGYIVGVYDVRRDDEGRLDWHLCIQTNSETGRKIATYFSNKRSDLKIIGTLYELTIDQTEDVYKNLGTIGINNIKEVDKESGIKELRFGFNRDKDESKHKKDFIRKRMSKKAHQQIPFTYKHTPELNNNTSK